MEPSELLGLVVALLALLGASALINVLFGHPTFFREADHLPSKASVPFPPPTFPTPVHSPPPSVPDRLPVLIPKELFVSEVLLFLSPYEVTRLLPTSRYFHLAGEHVTYWQHAWTRRLAGMRQPLKRRCKATRGPEELLTHECHNPKLEFFRRMFVYPYELTYAHCHTYSCRIIVHGKVRLSNSDASSLCESSLRVEAGIVGQVLSFLNVSRGTALFHSIDAHAH